MITIVRIIMIVATNGLKSNSDTNCQVVPRTCRGGSFEKETWLIGIHGELERSELKML